jgi:hypothetical protein
MFIVDDAVFSMECFNWFSERTGETVIPSDKIVIFRFLLEKKHQSGHEQKETYMDLDVGAFWTLLNEILMLLTDVHKTERLPRSVTISQLRVEMAKVERVVVYWALCVNYNNPDPFGSLEKEFITADGLLNNKFCLYVYYITSACYWGIDKLETAIAGRDISSIGEGELTSDGVFIFKVNENNEFIGNDEGQEKFIKDLVRVGYGGDFDEFIISVKEDISNQTMGPYHQQLALARGYELMGISDFTPVPLTETWRRLFTTYFDGEEDNYAIFYNTYTHQCIFYICLDFLSLDKDQLGIDYLPVYKIFSANKFSKTYSDDIKELLNTKLIRKQLYTLYKKKI